MTNKMVSYTNVRIILLSEYLFVLLPFVVIAIVKIYTSTFDEFLEAPDWSFASSILFGQLLVKLVSGSIIKKEAQWQRVSLLITLIFVLGLVPCLIVLTLMLIDNGQSSFLIYMQVFLFVLSTLSFFFISLPSTC